MSPIAKLRDWCHFWGYRLKFHLSIGGVSACLIGLYAMVAVSSPQDTELEAWLKKHGAELQFLHDSDAKDNDPIVTLLLDRTRGIDPGFVQDGLADEDLAMLQRIPALNRLSLANRPKYTDKGLSYLSGLSELTELNLSHSDLKGYGLGHLSGLNNLRHVDLSSCHWLNDESAKYLEHLGQVRSISLDGKSNEWFSNDIWKRAIQVDPSYHEQFSISMLERLRGGLTDSGLAHVAKLDKLTELSLVKTRITDKGLSRLVALKQLQRLDLSRTAVTDAGLKHLLQLKDLRALKLNYTYVSDVGLAHLAKLPHLESLELVGTNISSDGILVLRHLESLKTLAINSTRMSDETLEHLRHFQNLEQVSLSGYRHSFKGLIRLSRENPRLELFDLLVDSGLASLGIDGQTVSLDLKEQSVGKAELAVVASLRDIESLDVSNSTVGDEALKVISQMPKLNYLNLIGSRVTSEGLDQLQGTRLTRLPIGESTLSFAAAMKLLTDRQGLSVQEALKAIGVFPYGDRMPTEVDCRAIRLAGTDLAKLSQFKPMTKLLLPKMRISESDYGDLASLPVLRQLWLRGARVTAQAVELLGSQTSIRELFATDCEMDAQALAAFKTLPNLEVLNLSGTLKRDSDFKLMAVPDSLHTLILDSQIVSTSRLKELKKRYPGVQVILSQKMAIEAIRGTSREFSTLPQGYHRTREMGAIRTEVAESPLIETYGDAFFEQATSVMVRDENSAESIEWLRHLPTLRRANVESTHDMTATLAALAALPKLEEISLYRTNTNDDDLRALASADQLQSLDLQRSKITDAGLVHLKDLGRLRVLRLGGYGTEIRDEGFSYIAKLTNLEELIINRTSITDASLDHVARLKKLRVLSMREVRVDEGLSVLPSLTKLERLDLDYTNLSDETVDQWEALPDLRSFSAAQTMLSKRGVARIQSLAPNSRFRTPQVYMTSESRQALKPLLMFGAGHSRDSQEQVYKLDLRPLKSLDAVWGSVERLRDTLTEILIGAHANDELIDKIATFPVVDSLDLSAGHISTSGLVRLSEMPELTVLKLAGCKLGEGDWEVIGKLDQLESLNLNGCEFGSARLEPVSSLQNLKKLFLTGASIMGDDLESLKKLANLEHLSLARTEVSQESIQWIQQLKELKSLYLVDSPLSRNGQALEELQRLMPDCKITTAD
ncbi:MAG: hypothetical protein ACE361_16360 [Aureliella sp.]